MSRDELEELQRDQTKRSKYFRHLEIRGLATQFLMAGFDTTASALAFSLFELAHNQQVQDGVYAEIREALEGRTFDQMDLSHIMELRKLDAFVSEVLRVHSIVILNTRVVTAKQGRTVMANGKPVHLPHGCVVNHNP